MSSGVKPVNLVNPTEPVKSANSGKSANSVKPANVKTEPVKPTEPVKTEPVKPTEPIKPFFNFRIEPFDVMTIGMSIVICILNANFLYFGIRVRFKKHDPVLTQFKKNNLETIILMSSLGILSFLSFMILYLKHKVPGILVYPGIFSGFMALFSFYVYLLV
jgi:hypothetical protein